MSRWPGGWGNWPAGRPARCPRRRRWRGSRRCPRRGPPAGRRPSATGAPRCSGRRPRYRRRCCRSCPGRRPAGSAGRTPGPAAPARRRRPGRRAGGYLPMTSPTIARALLVGAVGIELQLAHGVQDAPVHGLEAVAHVGQRAVHDGGERVGEIALLQRILELDGLDGGGRGENRGFGHGVGYRGWRAGSSALARQAFCTGILHRFRGLPMLSC